jgi:hypothetical protein
MLNEGDRTAVTVTSEFSSILQVVETLREEFKALLAANAESWKVRAEATH